MYWALWLNSFNLIYELAYDSLVSSSAFLFFLMMLAFALVGLFTYFKEDRQSYKWVHKIYASLLFFNFLMFLGLIITFIYQKSKLFNPHFFKQSGFIS